jgi:hypothetical protein
MPSTAKRAGERDDVDPPRAGLAQRRRGCAGGGARRVDIVDEEHPGRRRGDRVEGARDVATPLREAAATLPSSRRPPEEIDAGELPPHSERARESLRRVMSSPQPPIGVGRDEGDDRRVRPWHAFGDERRRVIGEPAQAALLPGRDEHAHRPVVGDGSPSRGEREPPSGAFAAATHRPGDGSATALAEGRLEPTQPLATAPAELLPAAPADEAALRQHQVEHTATLRARASRNPGGSQSSE